MLVDTVQTGNGALIVMRGKCTTNLLNLSMGRSLLFKLVLSETRAGNGVYTCSLLRAQVCDYFCHNTLVVYTLELPN